MKTGANIAHFAEAELIKMLIKAQNIIKLIIIPYPVKPLAFNRLAPLIARRRSKFVQENRP